MHLNFKYWQKFKLCQSKVCNILKNSGLSIKKLRNLRFFRFGSLSVVCHAYEGLLGFGLLGFGLFGLCFALVFVGFGLCFSRCQKKFSEICKKLLTFPFRCAILEANNGFGRFALRSLLRKILTSPSEAFPPYAIFR